MAYLEAEDYAADHIPVWTCPETGRDLVELHGALTLAGADAEIPKPVLMLLRHGAELLLTRTADEDEVVMVRLPPRWRETVRRAA
jgi:hypothetical protein